MYVDNDICITQPIANRLIGLIGTRLVHPVTPMSGMGIADLIFQASCLNRITLFEKHPIKHTSRMERLDFKSLNDMLGTLVEASDLAAISYLPVPPRTDTPARTETKINFFGTPISPLMFTPHRRVAPHSSKHYSKALWHVHALTFDAHSHERLLWKCRCGNALDFRSCKGVTRCFYCPHIDFRDDPLDIVNFGDPEAISFLTGLIDPENVGSKYGPLTHPDLISAEPGDLFTICVKVAELLTIKNSDVKVSRGYFDVPPFHLETAARALLNWPDGIMQVIEDIEGSEISRSRRDSISDVRLIKRLNYLISPDLHQKLRGIQHSFKVSIGSYENDVSQKAGDKVRDPLEVARNISFCHRAAEATGLSPLVLWSCSTHEISDGIEKVDASFGTAFSNWLRSASFDRIAVASCKNSMPLKNFVKAAYKGKGDPWPFVIQAILENRLPISRRTENAVRIDDLEVSSFDSWQAFLSNVKGMMHVGRKLRRVDTSFFLNITKYASANLFPTGATFQTLTEFDGMWVKDQELSDQLRLGGRRYSPKKISFEMKQMEVETIMPFQMLPWRNRSQAEKVLGLS